MSQESKKSTIVLDEYNNQPMLTINKESKFPYSFGLTKARWLVEHAEAIKKFVESAGARIE